jgi:hypothetical protein
VPFVKYPANPPSVGHSETVGDRTGLYLVMVVCSLLFGLGAVWLGRRLAPRYGNWTATLLAAGAFIVVIGIVMAVLPSLGICRSTPPRTGCRTLRPRSRCAIRPARRLPGFPRR